MIVRYSLMTAAVATMALLGGCAYPDTRGDNRTGYDQGGRYNSTNYDSGYQRGYSNNCSQCGVVVDVERVYAERGGSSTSGGGAVLGAIIGGVLGNQVGKGDGRKVATVAGAVAGGFAGNAVERNSGSNGRDSNAYRIYVDMDDGRNATVTQYRNPGLRRGDRVVIRNQQVELIR